MKAERYRFPICYHALPIKWKLTLWSALLLFLLFGAYNIVQYVFVERWMIKEEQASTQQDMREILNVLLEKEFRFEESEYSRIRSYLEKVNQSSQLIRVFDEKGLPIIAVSDDFPNEWIADNDAVLRANDNHSFSLDNMLVMRSPFTIFEFHGTVEIVKSMEDFEKLINAFLQVMLLCGLGAVMVSAFGGRLLARQLLRPLQAMNETMQRVKQNGLQERIQLTGSKDEIHSLMNLFNEMMDQVERSFAQQRQFVEDASHELRTPIAILEGHLAMLRRWGKQDPAVLEESLDISLHELARLKGLVQELLRLSRAERSVSGDEAREADPTPILSRLIKHAAALYPSFRFEAELEDLGGIRLAISEQHLEQIFIILMDNAVKYSGDSRTVRIRGAASDGQATLAVIDCGIGISEESLPYVWDRFYRADKSRSGEQGGYGLGLSIAKRLAEGCGGTIQIDSRLNEGTTVTVTFPEKIK